MACIIEGDNNPVWYCDDCGDGPQSWKLCGKCCDCGQERRKTAVTLLTPVHSDNESTPRNQRKKSKKKGRNILSPKSSIPPTQLLEPSVASKGLKIIHSPDRSQLKDASAIEKIQPTPQSQNANSCDSPSTSDMSWNTKFCSSPCSVTSSSENEDSESEIPQARYLAKQLLHSLIFTFNAESDTIVYTTYGSDSANTSSSNLHIGSEPSASSSTNRGSKRNRGNRGYTGKGNNGDEDEDDDRRKRHMGSRAPSATCDKPASTFACPFLKYNYAKYSNWTCRKKGWKEIHRLKEHLYKCHRPCEKCGTTFLTKAELEPHVKADKGCSWQSNCSENAVEGMTAQMEAQLRSRANLRGKDSVKRWRDIYQILFDTECALSPYFGVHGAIEESFQTFQQNASSQAAIRPLQEFAQQRLLPIFETLLEQHLVGTTETDTVRILESLDGSAIDSAIQTALDQLLPHSVEESVNLDEMPQTAPMQVENTALSNQEFPVNELFPLGSDIPVEMGYNLPSQGLAEDSTISMSDLQATFPTLQDSFESNEIFPFNNFGPPNANDDCDLPSTFLLHQDTYTEYNDMQYDYSKSSRVHTAQNVNTLIDYGYNIESVGTYLDPGELLVSEPTPRIHEGDLGLGTGGNNSSGFDDFEGDDWGLGPI